MKNTRGTVEKIFFKSQILKDNPLGDPFERSLYLYLPPGYSKEKKFPAVLGLTGFTGTGASLFNIDPLSEDLAERMDRLIHEGICPPLLIVAPDCFTRVGGSQYINSSATGRYEDYLIQEIIPFVNEKYSPSAWGVFGKSSGGFGAITLGMRHPEIFQALACHSGDSNFELSYLPDFGRALTAFKNAGGPKEWLEKFWKDVNHKRKGYHDGLNVLGMAACYSPNPKSELGLDLPFDLKTGTFRPEVWSRWQDWDPVRAIPRYAENLKKLKFLYIDCGLRDEFHLHWGALAMVGELKKLGIKVHFEDFDDGHMSIPYRYDRSLPLLAKALL
jgi:S-formylglutathione hydrolase FrmB